MADEVNHNERASRSVEMVVLPLALAQFVVGFGLTGLNAAIRNVAADTHTTVLGVQTALALFALIAAALTLPGTRLTGIWGRKLCLIIGLLLYGIGAVLAGLALSLGTLVVGYAVLQGIGAALIVPPIYFFITALFPDASHRARYLGFAGAAGGVGAALGPLIGGIVTSAASWRFLFFGQIAAAVLVLVLISRLPESGTVRRWRTFDATGSVVFAAGLLLVVLGVLLSRTHGWLLARQSLTLFGVTVIARDGLSPVWLFVTVGAVVLVWSFRRFRLRAAAGQIPALPIGLLRNRAANLGLAAQAMQWLVLQGAFFVVAVFLRSIRGYSAVETGLVLTALTVGLLAALGRASRMAAMFPPGRLVRLGFVVAMVGLALLMFFANDVTNVATFLPGLLVLGVGLGMLLTPSAQVVQSNLPAEDQSEAAALSRSSSGLGASLGVALAGSVLTATVEPAAAHFFLALLFLFVVSTIGWFAAGLMPNAATTAPAAVPGQEYATGYDEPNVM